MITARDVNNACFKVSRCRKRRSQLPELKAAQENAVPKQQEVPPGDAGIQLSSEDMTDLTDMLKTTSSDGCFLLH